MNWLKSYKSINLLLWKILQKPFPTTATRFFQLPTYPSTGEVFHQYLLTIKIHCWILSKLNNFSFCRKQCAATIKPNSLFMILQSLQFILFCVQKKFVLSNCGQDFKKCIFWRHCALLWWGEHREFWRFGLWYYFLPWDSYKNQTDQPRTELGFQMLWKLQVHSQ